jgi:hypothetical protein
MGKKLKQSEISHVSAINSGRDLMLTISKGFSPVILHKNGPDRRRFMKLHLNDIYTNLLQDKLQQKKKPVLRK